MRRKKEPTLEPKTRMFIETIAAQAGDPLYTLSTDDARKVLEKAQAVQVSKCDAQVEDRIFPAGPTMEVPVTIYRPVGAEGPLPVAMYFHGGG